jgi:hypothetical protein
MKAFVYFVHIAFFVFTLAHLARCAAAILRRADADIRLGPSPGSLPMDFCPACSLSGYNSGAPFC